MMNHRKACFIRSSINIDQYLRVEKIVRPGETISSLGFTEKIGGKGANTAVAISKAGQLVYFSGLIDHQSSWLKTSLTDLGVDVQGLNICNAESKLPTGRAIIQVSQETGENAIVLVPGTNHAPAEFWADIRPILDPTRYSHVLLQNEIPLGQTVTTSKVAHSLGITTVFNPSPLPSAVEVKEVIAWDCIDWLIVNEEEARTLRDRATSKDHSDLEFLPHTLTDLEPEFEVLKDLIRLSLATFAIVVTLGARGSLLAFRSRDQSSRWLAIHTPAGHGTRPVVDTTGAGDCFAGFLIAELMKLDLAESKHQDQRLFEQFKKSMKLANQAARLCVENYGTIDSYASLEQVQSLLSSGC